MSLKSLGLFVLHLIIVTILLTVGAFGFFQYLKLNHHSLLSVEVAPENATVSGRLNTPLLKNDSFKIEFTNPLPRLGIVSLRFLTFSRINQDSLAFSIKSKAQKDWYYSNVYKTDQFQPGQLFPFGFPQITDSENKTFSLEVTSLSGSPISAVALSSISPVITTRQVFSLGDLKERPDLLFRFLRYKLKNIFSDPPTFNQLLISFLPLLVYLTVYPKVKNKFALFTLMLFLLLMVIGSFAPRSVIELISAIAVISCVILTAYYAGKIIRYQSKHVRPSH